MSVPQFLGYVLDDDNIRSAAAGKQDCGGPVRSASASRSMASPGGACCSPGRRNGRLMSERRAAGTTRNLSRLTSWAPVRCALSQAAKSVACGLPWAWIRSMTGNAGGRRATDHQLDRVRQRIDHSAPPGPCARLVAAEALPRFVVGARYTARTSVAVCRTAPSTCRLASAFSCGKPSVVRRY